MINDPHRVNGQDASEDVASKELASRERASRIGIMLDVPASNPTLFQTYGPLFPAAATIVAATVAAFAARGAMRSARASEQNVQTAKMSMELANRAYLSFIDSSFCAKSGCRRHSAS